MCCVIYDRWCSWVEEKLTKLVPPGYLLCVRVCMYVYMRTHLQLGGSVFRWNYFIHIDRKMFTECHIGPDFDRFMQHTCAMLPLYRITVSCMIFRLRAQISTVSWLLSHVNSLQWNCCTLSHVDTNIYIYIYMEIIFEKLIGNVRGPQ